MPTPVNHLVMARELLDSGQLVPSAQDLLEAEWGPFLLGHTAPDVQTVSAQPRRNTHFYTIPPSSSRPAYRALLIAHPDLAQAGRLARAHAAFLAGYLAHLKVDEGWWRGTFYPFFGPQAEWATWEQRIFLHNVLRTWLDRRDQTLLDGREAQVLGEAEPQGWLPFVQDEDLRAWRDLLIQQLQPGERVRTAEVFAARMHVPAEAVEAALNSPEQLDHIFRQVPLERLEAYRADGLRDSAELISKYLEGGP
jgi:hypothetical protein